MNINYSEKVLVFDFTKLLYALDFARSLSYDRDFRCVELFPFFSLTLLL
jgi:hypothetical protein